MKNTTRILSAILMAVMLLSTFSVTAAASADDVPYNAFADYGQQTFEAPASEGITIDGVVSEDEYACTPIEVDKDSEGMTFLDWTKAGFPEEELPEILPYSVKYYVTYDAEALYVAAEIVEASLYTRCDNISEIWGLDSLEVDISADAYNEIPDDTFSHSDMLDRVRSTYALWDDGSGALTPVGLCYNTSTYSMYQELGDMGEYAITRDEDKQLTTYEMKYYWGDLCMEDSVPEYVFINLQLHLGDGRYLDYVQDGYVSCLGGLRYACQLTEEEGREIGTDMAMAPHIFKLTDAAKLNGSTDEGESATAAPETETPTEEVTEEITEAPTAAPETEAPTAEETTVETTADETDAPKSGCGSVVGFSAVSVAMAMAAAVALKKKG